MGLNGSVDTIGNEIYFGLSPDADGGNNRENQSSRRCCVTSTSGVQESYRLVLWVRMFSIRWWEIK